MSSRDFVDKSNERSSKPPDNPQVAISSDSIPKTEVKSKSKGNHDLRKYFASSSSMKPSAAARTLPQPINFPKPPSKPPATARLRPLRPVNNPRKLSKHSSPSISRTQQLITNFTLPSPINQINPASTGSGAPPQNQKIEFILILTVVEDGQLSNTCEQAKNRFILVKLVTLSLFISGPNIQ